jgi:hypothetical protein
MAVVLWTLAWPASIRTEKYLHRLSSCILLKKGPAWFAIYLQNDTMKMPEVCSFERYDQNDMFKGHYEDYCLLVDSSCRNVKLHDITSLKIVSNLHTHCYENLTPHRHVYSLQCYCACNSSRRTLWLHDVLSLAGQPEFESKDCHPQMKGVVLRKLWGPKCVFLYKLSGVRVLSLPHQQ